MPRPFKYRRVAFLPSVNYFKPAGTPLRSLGEIRLSIEEAEAIRLKDLEGLEQEEGAKRMNISRPTFQRVLATARQKVADALLNGKAIRIEGGSFEIAMQRLRCTNGHEWDVPFEIATKTPALNCPTCNTPNIVAIEPPVFSRGRRGWGRRQRGTQQRYQ